MGSSLISFFYFDTSLRISISRLGSNQAADRFLNTFISLSDLIQCLVERLYNEPAADAYSCYLSFLLYIYPSSLVLLYYSNIIFQAYCTNRGPCPYIAFFSYLGVFKKNACLIKILSFSFNFYHNRGHFSLFFFVAVIDRY